MIDSPTIFLRVSEKICNFADEMKPTMQDIDKIQDMALVP